MKQLQAISITIAVALLATLSVQGQVADNSTKHFEKNGLEFDYPAAWKMTEGSTDELQYVELATETKTVQLIVHWRSGVVLECHRDETRKRITQALADGVATQIHTKSPPETSWQPMRFGQLAAWEIQLHGLVNNSPVTAIVYSLTAKGYFLNLVYLKSDKDESGTAAWETIRATLNVIARGPLVKAKKPSDGGILNGKAILLPAPYYPAKAKAAHASGIVATQVLIDEQGNVIEVCVISGNALLREAATEAAWHAKFTSTELSGKPIRVTGTIEYNFVYR